MKIAFKGMLCGVLLVGFFALLRLPAFASDGIAISDDVWNEFANSVPKEALPYFGDGAFDDEESFFASVEELTVPESVVLALIKLFGIEAGSLCKLLFLLMGVVIVSAGISAIAEQTENKTLSAIMRFCSLGAIFSASGYVFIHILNVLMSFFHA